MNRSFQEGHKGGFISSKEFREDILRAIERRKEQEGKGGRRRDDRGKSKSGLNWQEFQRKIKTVVQNNGTALDLSSWQNKSKAVRQITWYLAFEKMGLSYEQIRQNEYQSGISKSVFGIVSAIKRIKKDPQRKKAAQNISNMRYE